MHPFGGVQAEGLATLPFGYLQMSLLLGRRFLHPRLHLDEFSVFRFWLSTNAGELLDGFRLGKAVWSLVE